MPQRIKVVLKKKIGPPTSHQQGVLDEVYIWTFFGALYPERLYYILITENCLILNHGSHLFKHTVGED